MNTPESRSSTIELPAAQRAVITVVGAVLGGVVGLLLPRIAGWALALPWTPLQGPLRLIDQYATGWVTWVLPVLGLALGLVGGLVVAHGMVKVQVTSADLTVIKGDHRTRFARAQVTLVQIDRGHLVLRGRDDEDLIREKLDISGDDVVAAARRHDWPLADR